LSYRTSTGTPPKAENAREWAERNGSIAIEVVTSAYRARENPSTMTKR
jgi:hypothetical protein